MNNGCFGTESGMSPRCYETVLQTMAEAVLIIDRSGVIRFCNQAASHMSGRPAEKIMGNRCSDLMSCACLSPGECELFKTGSLSSVECRVYRHERLPLPVLKNGRVITNESGDAIGAVETLTDISVLRDAENRLAQLEKDVRARGSYHGMIGRSKHMREVFELIDLAGASGASILITGETGTGKELTARAVHDKSSRKDGSFIVVNCSALPESLLESELFGHARGAFTGAVKDKMGRFETADGGTLFLDEIGEISPLIQVKLLRFLQTHEFERVGESQTRKADVRIVAATNRDLRKMVQQGEFREDLYYRLKVFPIHLPPLRKRREDIGDLAEYFIKEFNASTGKNLSGFTHDAAITMMDYCWPGNIRELENAIEHAFVTCPEGQIGVFDLPVEIRRYELRESMCPDDEREDPVEMSRRSIGNIDKKELSDILSRFGWNKSEVARHFNVDRTTVWRRMKKLGIPLSQKN